MCRWCLGRVSVMCSDCVVMFWWYVGDALVLCWWCLCSVSVMLWCLSDGWRCCGDVFVMVLWCFGDEYWWTFSNFQWVPKQNEWLFDVSLLLGSYAGLIYYDVKYVLKFERIRVETCFSSCPCAACAFCKQSYTKGRLVMMPYARHSGQLISLQSTSATRWVKLVLFFNFFPSFFTVFFLHFELPVLYGPCRPHCIGLSTLLEIPGCIAFGWAESHGHMAYTSLLVVLNIGCLKLKNRSKHCMYFWHFFSFFSSVFF